jgi:hypothetical protein
MRRRLAETLQLREMVLPIGRAQPVIGQQGQELQHAGQRGTGFGPVPDLPSQNGPCPTTPVRTSWVSRRDRNCS